ncbi:MAG TPA: hypothetical protein VGL81_13885 [Polyangiaceae bacterium]|jgi:hypothetical protein
MARAALRLYGAGQDAADLRVPMAFAIVELYGAELPDEEVATLVEALLPVERAELDPRAFG